MEMIEDQFNIIYDLLVSANGPYRICIVCADTNELNTVLDYMEKKWKFKIVRQFNEYTAITFPNTQLIVCIPLNIIKCGRFHLGLCSENIDDETRQEIIEPIFNKSFPCGYFNPKLLEE